MECKVCGYYNSERVNAYGTFCPKCGEHCSPLQKVPLIKSIEEKKKQDKDMIREYLRKKMEGTKHAN